MFNTKGLMTSKRLNWKTPKALYDSLDRIFQFNFDPCPPNPDFDGLNIEWKERNFVNPPYGGEIKKWVKKSFEESSKGKLVVMLIPSRTDTRYWHDYVMKAKEIWFIKGRLKFDDHWNSAPFPSAIIIFRPQYENKKEILIKSVNILGKEL